MSTPYPVPPAAPAPRSTRGAKLLTFSGVVLLVAALAVGIGVGRQFVGLLPLDVLTADGEPGPAVVASVDAPGTAEVELAADRYAVLLAHPTPGGGRADDTADDVELAGDLRVTAPDGSTVDASGGPQVSLTTGRGTVAARTVAAFEVTAPGTYTVTVPATTDGTEATVLLTPDRDFAPFFTGIFSTILGTFLTIGLGLLGFLMTLGGIVWWVLARRPRLP